MENNQVNQCVKHIKEKYKNIETLSLKDIVSIVLQWGEDDAHEHAAEWYKWKLEKEKKKQDEMTKRIDYEEEIDDEGKIWYKRTHLYEQREDSRKLKPGDIIQYKGYLPGYEGEMHGIMLINSFDFKSDFACRSYFNFEVCERYKKADKLEDRFKEKEEPYISWGAGSAPSINAFSLATEQEIENFFKTIKEDWPEQYKFYFLTDFKYKPKYLEERYAKYIN